jgi:hypothetical protein
MKLTSKIIGKWYFSKSQTVPCGENGPFWMDVFKKSLDAVNWEIV